VSTQQFRQSLKVRDGVKMPRYSSQRADYRENNEYYTPKWVFEFLNARFDIDVAAPKGGVEWLPADNHYDIDMDGLQQNWYGFVWCNPPYSNPTPFIEKFLSHANGIMLVQVSKSNAFLRLWNESDSIMMLPRNIMFEHKEHGKKGIFMPVALFGMGEKAKMHMDQSGINKVR
jgi:hypothetical protein